MTLLRGREESKGPETKRGWSRPRTHSTFHNDLSTSGDDTHTVKLRRVEDEVFKEISQPF